MNDAQALAKFHHTHFPNLEIPAGSGSRVESVARFRDTKAMANDSAEIISARVWQDEALTKDNRPVGAALANRVHGVFSFVLNASSPYQLHGVCALVENPTVFAAVEKIAATVCGALYGYGRISNRALAWLESTEDSSFHLIHLPDYDPVGLSEFQRLRLRLGSRVSLHLPDDLETRFKKFSKRELLASRNNQVMLAKLRKSNLPEIRHVTELIDRHNAGLEQEALLV